MADIFIASAIALPDPVDEVPASTNPLKRRQSEEAEQEREKKRQRISPGKSSPSTAKDDTNGVEQPNGEGAAAPPPGDKRQARRKSNITEEKQRSKRLFGALLGSLNQPGDRTSKRRQEIESRRKAELQRQDDERVEDKLRRQEKLVEVRKREQIKVDEEDMHTRHRNMLSTANFLQTTSEPKLYYRPWDLRADEEDRIDEQIKEVQARIDKELDEFEQRQELNGHAESHDTRPDSSLPDRDDSLRQDQASQQDLPTESSGDANRSANFEEEEEPPRASAKSEDSKPAEVPDSDDPTNGDTNNVTVTSADAPTSDAKPSKSEEAEEEGDHVGEGDEDTVIY